jgi:hypothetical protein
MEYDPIDEESRQRFLGETSFEKEKLQARGEYGIDFQHVA